MQQWCPRHTGRNLPDQKLLLTPENYDEFLHNEGHYLHKFPFRFRGKESDLFLRQNFPYALDLKEGSVVTAGDVIGYMGHTGYSAKENVNNIETVHLHFGLQLIFDESQKEGNNEIWIDCYDLTRFLYKNRSLTEKNAETKEWFRTFHIKDPSVTSYLQLNPDAPVLNNGN